MENKNSFRDMKLFNKVGLTFLILQIIIVALGVFNLKNNPISLGAGSIFVALFLVLAALFFSASMKIGRQKIPVWLMVATVFSVVANAIIGIINLSVGN